MQLAICKKEMGRLNRFVIVRQYTLTRRVIAFAILTKKTDNDRDSSFCS